MTHGTQIAVATTTAWASGDPVDVVLERINTATGATIVELAVGARPQADADVVLDRWAAAGVEFFAHHTVPYTQVMRPNADPGSMERIITMCRRHNIGRYSCHPLSHNQAPTWEAFLRWADNVSARFETAGIAFSLETMYPPADERELNDSGGWWLSHPDECALWAERSASEAPLLIDLSHLHIGFHAGVWNDTDIDDLLRSGWARELHVSLNNGQRDSHRPMHTNPAHIIARWYDQHRHRFDYIVDEGRRRGKY